MFYDCARNDHGLPFNPLKGLVVPRPIGWISTVGADGRFNLAPFSFFNLVSERPPMVMFCPNGPHAEGGVKDTLRNVEAQGEFVVNLATYELRDAVNASAAPLPRGADEFRHAGLTPQPSRLVRPPAVQESPVQLECRLHQVIRLPGEVGGVANHMVLGAVLGVAIRDELIQDGRVRVDRLRPISRLGYMDYAVTEAVFTMERPTLAPLARPEAVAQD